MSREYWTIAAETLLDECGISVTREQLDQLGRRLNDASSEQGQFDGSPSHRVDPAPKANPLQERCEMLQNALDRMAHRYGVTVDPERMEIQYHGHAGGTVYATQREKI